MVETTGEKGKLGTSEVSEAKGLMVVRIRPPLLLGMYHM